MICIFSSKESYFVTRMFVPSKKLKKVKRKNINMALT
jgi:hypothetical protein